jgi:hypothetical protein
MRVSISGPEYPSLRSVQVRPLEPGSGSERLDRPQGLLQVRHQVVGVLAADANADEAVGDAELVALLLGVAGVGRGGGVGDQGLDAAQALPQGAQARTLPRNRSAASRLPRSKQMRAPKPVDWCLWTSWFGWSGRPGQ